MGRSVTHVGSGGALRVWEILDFELPRHFNISILATKTALKYPSKLSVILANPKKYHHWNSFILIYIERKTLWVRRIIELIQYFLFYWMNGCIYTSWGYVQASQHPRKHLTQGDSTFLVQKHRKCRSCWWLGNPIFTCLWFSFQVYLRRQNLRLFTAVKIARKWKVFEWQVFRILMCARNVLHTSSTSTSCCSIIPGGTWNINFFYLAINNLM